MTRIAAGFEAVAEEFAHTIQAGAGGAFAAFVDGEPVVDVWGGFADPERGAPWQEDTAQLLFSGTKGLVAVCLLLLVERRALDLDTRVYPGRDVLVRHVVSHTAGLPGLRRGFRAAELLDGRRLAAELANQEPFWPPGSRLAYHAQSFGWICDDLVRRISGHSLGRFFAREVAGPLGLDAWIGVTAEIEPRVARVVPADGYGITLLGEEPEPLLSALYGELLDGVFPWNEPAFHRAEIPAANGIATARSVARLYGCLARGGELDGVRLLAEESVQLGRTELSRGRCAVTRRPYAFGVGFELQTELASFGPPRDAFGHTGSGGSVHGAWPDARVGFSYVPGELRAEAGDDRARRILAALHAAVQRS